MGDIVIGPDGELVVKNIPKGAVRGKGGALIIPKKERGKNIDLRVLRKIIKEMYRVMPEEIKAKMKPKVKVMVELL